MLVGRDEGLISQDAFEVDAQGLDAVAHGVCRGDSREVLKEVGHHTLVHRLIEVVIIVRRVAALLLLVLRRVGWKLLWSVAHGGALP